MTHIAKGIRKIKRPKHTDIFIDHKGNPWLNVTHADGMGTMYRVSKRVAETLIARGMTYQG